MTAYVCTAWYRASELLAATATPHELDAPHRSCPKVEYGMSFDVWSYGAVVYETLAGEPLARACDGAGALANLIAVLGPCPDCAHSRLPGWSVLEKAASHVVTRRQLIPDEWSVPVACLRWVPGDRATTAQVLQLEWLHHACADAASPRACLLYTSPSPRD